MFKQELFGFSFDNSLSIKPLNIEANGSFLG